MFVVGDDFGSVKLLGLQGFAVALHLRVIL